MENAILLYRAGQGKFNYLLRDKTKMWMHLWSIIDTLEYNFCPNIFNLQTNSKWHICKCPFKYAICLQTAMTRQVCRSGRRAGTHCLLGYHRSTDWTGERFDLGGCCYNRQQVEREGATTCAALQLAAAHLWGGRKLSHQTAGLLVTGSTSINDFQLVMQRRNPHQSWAWKPILHSA